MGAVLQFKHYSLERTFLERKVRLCLGSFMQNIGSGGNTEREGQVYLWAACLSVVKAGCLAHCLWQDAAAEPQGQGEAAERIELGCCQFLKGAQAAESCPCADEEHQQGVQKRLTAAAGPASLGFPAWKPSVSYQTSLGGQQWDVRTWALGS